MRAARAARRGGGGGGAGGGAAQHAAAMEPRGRTKSASLPAEFPPTLRPEWEASIPEIMASYMQKKSPVIFRGWQERYVRLQADLLCYFDPINGRALVGAIDLSTVADVRSKDKVFEVTARDPKRARDRAWSFRTATPRAARMWADAVRKAAAEAAASRHRNDSVARPVHVDESIEDLVEAVADAVGRCIQEDESAAPDEAPTEAAGAADASERAETRESEAAEAAAAAEPEIVAAKEAVESVDAVASVMASEAREAVDTDAHAAVLKSLRKRAEDQGMDLSIQANTGRCPSKSSNNGIVARRSAVRSAAAERFASGLAQKEAAINMAVHSAASSFRAGARKKKVEVDAAKINPLLDMLSETTAEPAAAAAAGGLANVVMSSPANALYVGAKGTIPALAALLRRTVTTGFAARVAPVLACLSAIAQDAECKRALVHCGVTELLPLCLAGAGAVEEVADDIMNYAAVLAANLATADVGREALTSTRVSDSLIAAFTDHSRAGTKLVGNLAAALANLACTREGKRACVCPRVLERFARVLGNDSEEAMAARASVCRAMGNVASSEPANAEVMAEAGLVKSLVGVLSAMTGVVSGGGALTAPQRQLYVRAAQALTNMAADARAAEAAFDAGVVDMTVSVVTKCNSRKEADVLEAALSLFLNLSLGHEVELAAAGVLTAAVGFITDTRHPQGVRLVSTKVVANLCTNADNAKTVREAGLPATLVILLRQGDAATQAAVCMAIAQLAKDSALKSELDAVGASDAIGERLAAAKATAPPTVKSEALLQAAAVAMANLV